MLCRNHPTKVSIESKKGSAVSNVEMINGLSPLIIPVSLTMNRRGVGNFRLRTYPEVLRQQAGRENICISSRMARLLDVTELQLKMTISDTE